MHNHLLDASSATIGFIGVGEIAAALVEGLSTDSTALPQIALSPRGKATSARLAQRYANVHVHSDNQAVVDASDLLFLTVRPDHLSSALTGLSFRSDALVISAVAGISYSALASLIGQKRSIVRVIPLPGVRSRSAPTVLFPRNPTAEAVLSPLGGVVPLEDEQMFNAFQAATGTISSQLDMLGAISDWLCRRGADETLAQHYVRLMASSLSARLTEESSSLETIIADHETPGGMNEQLRREWLDAANLQRLDAALDRLYQRVSEASEEA